jgi:hypothetical protein
MERVPRVIERGIDDVDLRVHSPELALDSMALLPHLSERALDRSAHTNDRGALRGDRSELVVHCRELGVHLREL